MNADAYSRGYQTGYSAGYRDGYAGRGSQPQEDGSGPTETTGLQDGYEDGYANGLDDLRANESEEKEA